MAVKFKSGALTARRIDGSNQTAMIFEVIKSLVLFFCPTLPIPRCQHRSRDDHMPDAPSPMLAVWLMQGSVWTVLGKSWVRIRPFSPPLPLPLILVRVEQRMASLMDCCQKRTNRLQLVYTPDLSLTHMHA